MRAGRLSRQRRSVTVNFGVEVLNDESGDRVVSFDVVPAFASGDDYEIDLHCSYGVFLRRKLATIAAVRVEPELPQAVALEKASHLADAVPS